MIGHSDGMFLPHGQIMEEGSHAMGLVGWSDEFKTPQANYVGGWILQNSLKDGQYGIGSHSIDYLLQKHSAIDERMICPNDGVVFNWLKCGSVRGCTTKYTKNSYKHLYFGTELTCINGKYCNATHNYWLKSLHWEGDEMLKSTFVDFDSSTGYETVLTLPLLPPFIVSMIFSPVNFRPNDPHRCGFWFLPYEVQADMAIASVGMRFFWATDLHVEFDRQSYIANKADFPNLDYSFIKQSTIKQRSYKFSSAWPDSPGSIVPSDWPPTNEL